MRGLRVLVAAVAVVALTATAQAAALPPSNAAPPLIPAPAPRSGHGFPIGVFVALPFVAFGIGAGLNALSHSEDFNEPPPLLPPSPAPPPPNPPQPTRALTITNHVTTFHVVNLPPKGETRFLPNEILVVFRHGAHVSTFSQRQKLQLVETRDLSLIGVRVQRFRFGPGRSLSNVLTSAGHQPQVALVEPHYVFALQDDTSGAKPQPAMLSYTGGLLHLTEAHKMATGRGVRIAVIDSQIDFTHPEIDGSVVAHFDALGSTDAKPELHGTAMASAIVGRHQIDGSAPDAQILAARVFTADGGPAASLDILAGIDWAATQKAQVINMSFAGPADPLMTRMLAAAAQRKIALIAAAGNDGAHPPPEYPASDPNVVAVSAIDSKDHVFDRASRGPYVALAAPGVDVLVAASNGGYDLSTGTSVACAEVSGIAALLLEKRPDLDGPALRKILRQSAHAIAGETGIGAGAADAEAAVMLVK